ncbi:MAG: hypothetical protein DLM73_13260 [Chthoniobacterales bacterium]|nr:MAG: hypothetical protein DLM73_13260 [Chthoniobacterales bacterium]
MQNSIDQEDYLDMRSRAISRKHGIDPDVDLDPGLRTTAIAKFEEQQEALLRNTPESMRDPVTGTGLPAWVPIGPFSIPNGQTTAAAGGTIAVSGRTTAVVTNPSDANVVYIGTAQGGVWRSKDGGNTWVSIFDNARSQAIGALALAPSNPSILYIGTGEAHFSVDSFFGIGLYRIDNADTTTGALADLKGPINPPYTFTANATGNPSITTTCFGGRAISQILVNPTDPATIFVSTSTGAASNHGNGLSSFVPPLALVGVYRSTNATAAPSAVTFTKLAVAPNGGSLDVPGTGNRRVSDMAFEPGNPDVLLAGVFGNAAAGDGGVFRSTNATSVSPTFTQTLTISATRINFAIQKTGAVVTVLAATSESSGTVACGVGTGQLRKSIDGGVTWPSVAATAATGGILTGADGFCGGQCVYDITVAMAPADPNTIYLGGNATGTCSNSVKKSTNGTTFVRDDNKVHADTQILYVSNTTPPIVFDGNDGGIWKRDATLAAGSAWTDLNKAPLNVTQFQSVAVHPTDRNFTIGGTQDNGTEAQDDPAGAGPSVSGQWISAEGGDGGFALIDSNSNATAITMYHTFFNRTGLQIVFDRALTRLCLATKDGWETRGNFAGAPPIDATPSCDTTPFFVQNGIALTDTVNFYAPMALGPGNPNTLYFGTDRLYRSINQGDLMTVVSQAPFAAGRAIDYVAISPQTDNSRIVGLDNGKVFATTTGAAVLIDTNFPPPNNAQANTFRDIGQMRFAPNDPNTAYISLDYYFDSPNATTSHVWKVVNLNTTPVWTPLQGTDQNVLPNIPVNALVVDPAQPNRIFAGTDIGVYVTQDGGANWVPFGQGLPRVAVFDMAIQPTSRLLRIATHGRGMWEIPVAAVAGPSLTTQVASAAISLGSSTSDTATLSGGQNPTGSITFRLFGPNDNSCSNAPIFTSVQGVNGNGTYTSGSFTPSAVGTYLWVASYSGDSNNGGLATPCGDANETVTVTLSQLVNVSTRARVEAGNGNEIIGGFIIQGSASKKVLIRGLGPSLQSMGLTDVLINPTLELHPASGPVVFNQDWRDTQAAAIQATGIPPLYDVESAILATLAPGNHTAILKGLNGGLGLGLIEVYDLDTASSKLVNLSTRASVTSGNNVMIGGFFVGAGNGGGNIVVRALGPSLSSGGVTNPLADPTLELRDGDGTLIMSDDNWQDNPTQATAISAAGLAPTNTKEAAIIKFLAPGAYTVIVQARPNTGTGVGLVEIYNVP